MIKREELAGKTQQEIQELLESDVKQFIVVVKELADEAETLAKEEEIKVLMDENDAHLRTVVYPVADEVTYDGTSYNKKTACGIIADFIATQEVEWSYTLGLFELCKLWRACPETIQYHAYDSTLRILGGMKYKGYESWRKILTVNAFLGTCHEEYVRDTAYMLDLSNLHNVVIDGLKRFNPGIDEEGMGTAEETPAEAVEA
jgi:hypothetical protein